MSREGLAEGALLLAVDVGNTNVKLGCFQGERLIGQWRLASDERRMADEYSALAGVLLAHSGIRFADIGGMCISSTVPALLATFRELADRYFHPSVRIVEVSSLGHTGITVAIDNPREMGADRVVDALAAARLYRLPAIIVDFGTATTFDAVDAKGRLLGTAIAPGFTTSMDGLFQRAAKLTRIEVERPETAIGRTTAAALRSGWVYGYVGLVEGLVARIKQELGGDVLVIATGGLADDVVAETDVIDVHDPLLTLQGLRLYYEMNQPADHVSTVPASNSAPRGGRTTPTASEISAEVRA